MLEGGGGAECRARCTAYHETENTRDTDALHRDLLDLCDVLLPLLGGWCAGIWSIEDSDNHIAGKDRIGLVLVDIGHIVIVIDFL